jgi:RimJ/RimL family protein N-acetyltransferase
MVFLRPAETADWARLWAWRNDPQTRENFEYGDAVSLAEHMRWLEAVLKDANTRLYVGLQDGTGASVGTCRVMRAQHLPDAALPALDCSVTVEPRYRGRGFAEPLITAMCRELADDDEFCRYGLVARIKHGNWASIRAFAACGFVPILENAGTEAKYLMLAHPPCCNS